MNSMEGLIAEILDKRKDLTREKIRSLIEEKKHEAQDLLSDQGAARLVAEELLIETSPTPVPSISIRDLVAGLNDVTLTGKVLACESTKSFVRQNGSTGRVARVLLTDETGKIWCVVWDDKADEVFKDGDPAGRTVGIRHGYTRANLAGEVELNAGERSEIAVTSECGAIDRAKFTPIGEIKEPAIELSVLGIIHSRPRIYDFERDGGKGTVLRTVIADTTGSIPIVAWNEKAEELRNLKRGDILAVQNGRLRRDNSGRLEIHLETRAKTTVLEKLPEGFQVPEIQFHKISQLKPNLPTVNLVARIVGTSTPQPMQRKTGESVLMSRILVGDETGIVSVSLWDDKAELASKLRIGDIVRIEDAVPNVRLGQMSIGAGRTALLEKVHEPSVTANVETTKIADAISKSGLVAIEGEVTIEPEMRDVTTTRNEKVQVTSLRLRDDTSEVKVSFWRTHAAQAGKLRKGARIRVYGLLPRPGLGGETELSTVQATSIEVLSHAQAERPSSDQIRQFIVLKENEQAWVRALVLDPGEDATLSSVCGQCEEPATPSDDQFTCPTHGAWTEPTWLLTMRMKLDDGTDTIVARVRTKKPQTLLGASASSAQKEILAKKASTVALPISATGKLAGMSIEAFGVTKRDPQTGKLVLHADRVFLLE